jgi:hypothetical protein
MHVFGVQAGDLGVVLAHRGEALLEAGRGESDGSAQAQHGRIMDRGWPSRKAMMCDTFDK